MSRKSDLLQGVKRFKDAYETLERTVNEKKASGNYTQVGFEAERKRLLEQVSGSVQQMHDNLLSMVDAGLEALENKWKKATAGKLADGGYQSGLANVLKMLEIGAITEQQDIQNIIDTYNGDYNALAAVKAILSNSSQETLKYYAALIPKDNRDESRRLLTQLRKNIDCDVTVDAIENAICGQVQGLTSLSLSLEGMVTFINDRLGDDLEVRDWQQLGV